MQNSLRTELALTETSKLIAEHFADNGYVKFVLQSYNKGYVTRKDTIARLVYQFDTAREAISAVRWVDAVYRFAWRSTQGRTVTTLSFPTNKPSSR